MTKKSDTTKKGTKSKLEKVETKVVDEYTTVDLPKFKETTLTLITCINCKHFKPFNEDGKQNKIWHIRYDGTCLLNPPNLFSHGNKMASIQSPTNKDWACGQWEE